jgi:hypothetical protein
MNILCVLCGSAVTFSFNINCLNNYCRILLEGFWSDFSDPNFYNIVGIKGYPHLQHSAIFFWGAIASSGGEF